MNYYIYQVSANGLLEHNRVDDELVFDLRKSDDYTTVISNVVEKKDNALFHQLKAMINDSLWTEASLLDEIVIVDFKNAASTNKNYIVLFNGDENGFDFKKSGFYFIGKDGIKRKYVAFDKSNSMARDSKITFINAERKEELDKRLLLGFPFNELEIEPSKYFSYRGLYLSDSERVDGLVLNEDTVIVIKDDLCNILSKKANIFTAEKGDDDVTYQYKYKTYEKGVKYKDFERNLFDGEGFIHPEYAKKINSCLGKEATSFQIRMPFMKGMLHEVNFIQFFEDCKSGYDPKTTTITDVFGISRNLSSARIILTESMFKCCKWLRVLKKNNRKYEEFKNNYDRIFDDGKYDYLKYLFYKVNSYDHGLYICGTSDSYRESNSTRKTTLNYQFVSTLNISNEDFAKLIDEHIKNITSDDSLYISDFSNEESVEEETVDNDDDLKFEDIWKEAAKKNPAVKQDKKVADSINYARKGNIRNLGRGRLITSGECRYLSGDLLSLLCHLYDQSSLKDTINERVDTAKRSHIWNGRFYMPNAKIELADGNNYAILRNPHLSKNELCIAKPFIPNPEEDWTRFADDYVIDEKTGKKNHITIMEKYFGHLDSVIMVSKDSLIPLALSGADFDGDLVKIYSNDIIVEGVKSCTYTKGDNNKEERIPVIRIPSENDNRMKELYKGNSNAFHIESIRYETILNTFRSNVGKLSNLAVVFGEMEKYIKANHISYDRIYSLIDNYAQTFIDNCFTEDDYNNLKSEKELNKSFESVLKAIGIEKNAAKELSYQSLKKIIEQYLELLRNAYFAGNDYEGVKKEGFPNYRAVCTILTGLDIDAVKNGVRPITEMKILETCSELYKMDPEKKSTIDRLFFLNTADKTSKEYGNKMNSIYRYYLERNEIIKEMHPNRFSVKYDEKKDTYELSYFQKIINKDGGLKAGSFLTKTLYPQKDKCSNLYMLPYGFGMAEKQVKKYTVPMEDLQEIFTFEDDKDWKNNLDSKTLSDVKLLMDAYSEVISIKQNRNTEAEAETSKYESYLYKNLQKIYGVRKIEDPEKDDICLFDNTGSSLFESLIDTYEYLKSYYSEGYPSGDYDFSAEYEAIEEKLKKQLDSADEGNGLDSRILLNAGNILFNSEYNDNDKPKILFSNIMRYLINKKETTVEKDSAVESGNNKYLGELINVYEAGKENKQLKKIWKDNVAKKAKEILFEMFEDKDDDNMLEYVYSNTLDYADKNSEFMWDILGNVALRNIKIYAKDGDRDAR